MSDQVNRHSERCRAGKQLNPKGCWCSEDSPKSAEEIAQEIVKERIGLDVQYWDGIDHYLAGRIAKALTEYAEARVKKYNAGLITAEELTINTYKNDLIAVRNSALEEAAKAIDDVVDPDHTTDEELMIRGRLVSRIRALKNTVNPEEEK